MSRRNIRSVRHNRPIMINPEVVSKTPQPRVQSNVPARATQPPPNLEQRTRERFEQNILATQNVPGDIVIFNPNNFPLPNIKTNRPIIYLDNLYRLPSNQISFLFVATDRIGDLLYIFRNVVSKISWGGLIFTPKYKVGNSELDKMWDKFVLENFMSTYTSRQKFIDPHKKTYKEEYFAIKYFLNPPKIEVSNRPLKIATVWRTGGTYKQDHVIGIYNACKKYINADFDFYCLTDFEGHIHQDINKVPLIHGWKGYWSKMELFRPDLFQGSDVFYLDLDTLITHDITSIATFETEFFGMRDFNMLNELSSGVLKFNADKFHYIYSTFLSNPNDWMRCKGGDQEAIRKILRTSPDYMQDLFPRRMAEFKNHCWDPTTKRVDIPSNYWIVCFHSSPKMDDIQNDPIIKKYWLR